MTKSLWINLPVKDLNKSKLFFKNIGFKSNPMHENSKEMASVMVGEKEIVLMLFVESIFKNFTKSEITDTKKSTEVLFSFDAESREEVNEIADKVVEAGGKVFSKPSENQGWMYGFGFSDIDGHKWAMLYLDMSKMPKF